MEKGKEEFAILKPVCVGVMREKSLKSVIELEHKIESMDSIVPELLEYVLLPIQMTIQISISSSNVHLTERSIQCMCKLFQRSSVKSEKTFHDTLNVLCAMIEPSDTPLNPRISPSFKGVGLSSEELLHQVLQAVQYLMLGSDPKIMESFQANLMMLGHVISLLLPLIEERDRKTKMHAISALVSLSQQDCSDWMESMLTTKGSGGFLGSGMGAELFPSFIPGVLSSISSVVLKDPHLGQAVTGLGILTLAHFISLVLNDNQYNSKKESSSTNNDGEVKPLHVCQDASWWSNTDSHIEKLLKRLLSLVNHDQWKVRLALGHSVAAILYNCSKGLPNGCGPALETLITLSHDEYMNVSSFVTCTLSSLSEKMCFNSSLAYQSEEKLYSLCSSLPRLIRGENESSKLVILKMFRGYLELLGSHVGQLTCSPAHMTRLLQALVQTVELNKTSPFLSEAKQNDLYPLLDEEWSIPLSFAHIRDDATVKTLQNICHLVGHHGNSMIVLDLLIQQISSSRFQLSEKLLIFRWMLSGMECNPSLLARVIEEMMELYEMIHAGAVYETSLILCIIEDVASKLCDEFSIHLQQVVGIIMACATSHHELVAQTGIIVTHRIAKHTGHQNIKKLINDCSDYIVDTVNNQLLYQTSIHDGCHILQTVITYCDDSMLCLMVDCMESLFMLMDHHHHGNVSCLNECWSVCVALGKRLVDWVAMETPAQPEDDDGVTTSNDGVLPSIDEMLGSDCDDKENVNIDDIAKYFKEYHEKKDKEIKEGKKEEQNINETVKTTNDRNVPVSVKCCVNIIDRCTHHLSSSDSFLKLKALDCLSHCFTALKDRENDLLPQVHNVWSSFTHRLIDAHVPVRIKAIDVLLVIAMVAKEFPRKRIIEGVWPKLITCLSKSYESSCHPTPTYNHSMEYKLLMKLLTVIPDLCLKLKVSVEDTELMAHEIVLYLSKNIHPLVQDQCIKSCKTLMSYNGDLMWLLLVQLVPSLIPHPPHHTLPPVKLPHCTTTELYTENVQQILTSSF